jgi:hypothetical protein
MNIHLTLKSTNQKTGPIPVSTSPDSTCPPACPFRGSGCYADSGPLKIHWSAVSKGQRGEPWAVFLSRVRSLPDDQLWRMNQAGDLPGAGNRIDSARLNQLASSNRGKRGFTYTHKPVVQTPGVPAEVVQANRKAVKAAVAQGFTINLSGNNVEHADRLAKTGLPVATVVPPGSPARFVTPGGNKVVVCPAQRSDTTTCDTCRLCSRADRGFIVGFLPHGSGSKKVSAVACNK